VETRPLQLRATAVSLMNTESPVGAAVTTAPTVAH
jgi:hypothetical protein